MKTMKNKKGENIMKTMKIDISYNTIVMIAKVVVLSPMAASMVTTGCMMLCDVVMYRIILATILFPALNVFMAAVAISAVYARAYKTGDYTHINTVKKIIRGFSR